MSNYIPRLLIPFLLISTSISLSSAITFQSAVQTEAALERYRQIEARGGWPTIPPGPWLCLGSYSERVLALRHRLRATGDLPPLEPSAQGGSDMTNVNAEMTFDHEVDQAVRLIQRRHGLYVDGIVGGKTLAALNVPVQDRIRQLQHNLERWQQPENLGDRYILVNIPDFTLRLIDQNREVWATRVVVGKRKRRTPILRSTIDYLIFNPYWHVPSRIAKQELLPRAMVAPHFLSEQQMEIVSPDGRVLHPSSIDWTVVNPHDFPYRIRQRPGAQNALGRVKFMFPNKHSVYLHDTSSPALFARAERALSHGCVRVEKPLELAAYLLQDPERQLWTPEQVAQVIQRGKHTYVKLPQPIDVHLVYRTAWADDDGTVQFRLDIYQHDDLSSEASPILLASQ
jgi:L,D-transpeptidase YcbB